jgi:thymidylate synthase (FAD)
MKVIHQSWSFESEVNGEKALRLIEAAGRTCWKSEDRAGDFEVTKKFVASIMSKNHESVLEHYNISVRMITDRGVTHEIVRHRIASYSQESTRYCNYSKDKFSNELTFIMPVWFNDPVLVGKRFDQFLCWEKSCQSAEEDYFRLLELGQTPQEARAVLPNSLKTEIVMTANLREWKHYFKMRASPGAHPQMRELARSMLIGFQKEIPVIYDEFMVS